MKILLIFIALAFSFTSLSAQINSAEAKAAYQNAEEAFSVGNLERALKELDKVDAALGIYTPKSAYLRVQIWNGYVGYNKANLAGAIQTCKNYLNLQKTFPDMSEEKLIEVTNLVAKLEKDEIEYAKTKLVEEKLNEIKRIESEKANEINRIKREKADILIPLLIKAIDSFMLAEFKYKAGESLDSLLARRPEVSKLIKDKFKKPSKVTNNMLTWSDNDKIGYIDIFSKRGVNTIWLSKNKFQIIYYSENLIHSNNSKEVYQHYLDYKLKFSKLFAGLSVLNDPQREKDYEYMDFTDGYKTLHANDANCQIDYKGVKRKIYFNYIEKELSVSFGLE